MREACGLWTFSNYVDVCNRDDNWPSSGYGILEMK